MNRYSPEVTALRNAVEHKFGRTVTSPTDFAELSDAILTVCHQNISISTLKRLWGYVEGYQILRISTLNVLATYVGYSDFAAFVAHLLLTSEEQSEPILAETLSVADVQVGDSVVIEWLPNRRCTLQYMGGDAFEVIDSQNSKLQPADTFCCSSFMLGQPLYLSNLVHKNSNNNGAPVSFVVGKKDGLSSITHLKK